MREKPSTWIAAALSCLFLTGLIHAGLQARIEGVVVDDEDQPLAGVTVTIRGTEHKYELTRKTNKKGRFTAMILDATRAYEIRLEAPGGGVVKEPIKLQSGGVVRRTWTIGGKPAPAGTSSSPAAAAMPAAPAVQGSNKAVGLYNEGATAYNAGNLDLALEKFEAALAEDADLLAAHSVMGSIYINREEYEQAARSAERVLTIEPDNIEGLALRHDALAGLGQMEDADAALDRLAELDPSPLTARRLFNAGLKASRDGDKERALRRYQASRAMDPALVSAHLAAAEILLNEKQYEQALPIAQRVLELEPGNAAGLALRYNALAGLGREGEAGEALDELQSASPEKVAEAFYERGRGLFNNGQIDEAIEALERTVAADPTHARAHYTLGLCYLNRGRNPDAVQHFSRFLELAPDDTDAGAARQLIEAIGKTG